MKTTTERSLRSQMVKMSVKQTHSVSRWLELRKLVTVPLKMTQLSLNTPESSKNLVLKWTASMPARRRCSSSAIKSVAGQPESLERCLNSSVRLESQSKLKTRRSLRSTNRSTSSSSTNLKSFVTSRQQEPVRTVITRKTRSLSTVKTI